MNGKVRKCTKTAYYNYFKNRKHQVRRIDDDIGHGEKCQGWNHQWIHIHCHIDWRLDLQVCKLTQKLVER